MGFISVFNKLRKYESNRMNRSRNDLRDKYFSSQTSVAKSKTKYYNSKAKFYKAKTDLYKRRYF